MSLHVRAKEIFLDALDLPTAERERFLAEHCGDDPALLAEVRSLLSFHGEEDEELEGDGEREDEDEGEEERVGAPDRRAAEPDSGGVARADSDRARPASPGGSRSAGRRDPASGDVLAKRYRMIARIGRGGMGDVWRADDLVLGIPIALKLIHSAGPEARRQIIHEVRLARQITHPSVCRVFDVGEDDGQVFLSMELVEGEDLATLLRRAGRLPSEKVVDIARQLCEGLAAAHARGVLHRDLKPANVLIDNDGHVRITDFGIAVTQHDTKKHVLVGTPAYMAPEQLKPGTPLSECTDLYALGIILYELITGQHPFDRPLGARVLPPAPSTRVPHVDASLERAVQQALEPDPKNRPGSVAEMAARLPATARPQPRRSAGWLLLGAVAALVLAAIIAYSFVLPRGSRALTSQDRIVLADFANSTGEPVFDGTLKVALAVALEQSPFLRVFPEDRVRDTLRLMGRPGDTRVTAAVAREIAQREQLKALVSGSIATLGSHFVLAIEAVNADTGDVMAREQIEVTRREDILASLGAAVSKLREKLGESLGSIQQFDMPLARATTPSLDALHAYSMALDEGRLGYRLDSIPHLRRALELDPDFALALALTASVYSNNGQSALASEFARKAFALRDRVSERERFVLAYRYYRDTIQDWDQAIETARLWTDTYPREAVAFNSLGASLINLGRLDDAVSALRRAIELDTRFSTPYANLAAVLMTLGHIDEAKAVLADAASHQLTSGTTRRITYLIAVLEGDRATATKLFNASIGVGQTNGAYAWEARTSAAAGQIRTAHELFRRGLTLAVQDGFSEVASQLALGDAEVHVVVNQCREAVQEANEGLTLGRDNFAIERASRVFALCGQTAQAAALTRELLDRYPQATLTTRIAVPMTNAAAALTSGDVAGALSTLSALRIYDRTPKSEFWIQYLRGQANLKARNGRDALDDFRNILDHRGENPNSPLYPLARLGLARAAVLSGDTALARRAYTEFLEAWKGADADLAILKEAQQEFARLS